MKVKRQEMVLSNENQVAVPDKPIILNKRKLLNTINKITEQKTLAALRKRVSELNKQVLNANSDPLQLHNISDNGDTVSLSQRFISDELKQISKALTLERGRYYLRRLAKSVTSRKTNKVNDINLNRWKEYDDIITDSLWVLDKRDSTGVHRADYWGNFIPQIPNQMIRRYTKSKDWVLDTFAGCGTSLIEAQRLGRNSIGIEIQPRVAETANQFIKSEPNKYNTVNEVVVGDSGTIDYRELLSRYGQKSVQLLIMHPPYFDIIKFSDDPRDLSNAPSVDDFLMKLGEIVKKAALFLDKNRYLAIVIGDKYSKGQWIPLGFLTMQEVLSKGFTLKSIIVKNFDQTSAKRNEKELWRYRALVGGFYIFKHEYVFLFKKI